LDAEKAVSSYPLPQVRQIIRFKVSRGSNVDVDALVSMVQPYFADQSSEYLGEVIRAMVMEAGGSVIRD
jgi:hypothetical protein